MTNTRRSFFRRFAAIAAVVALAPQIAFQYEIPFECKFQRYVGCDITLHSTTWTAIVECPDKVLVIENFSE